MKWSEIQKQYPDKFILLGDISEEKISETSNDLLLNCIEKQEYISAI